MKNLSIVFLVGLVVMLAGCGRSISDNTIVGKWKTTVGTWEFRGDGTLEQQVLGVAATDTWKLIKVDGDHIHATEQPAGMARDGKPFPPVNVEYAFEGPNKFTRTVTDNPAAPRFVFERI